MPRSETVEISVNGAYILISKNGYRYQIKVDDEGIIVDSYDKDMELHPILHFVFGEHGEAREEG